MKNLYLKNTADGRPMLTQTIKVLYKNMDNILDSIDKELDTNKYNGFLHYYAGFKDAIEHLTVVPESFDNMDYCKRTDEVDIDNMIVVVPKQILKYIPEHDKEYDEYLRLKNKFEI